MTTYTLTHDEQHAISRLALYQQRVTRELVANGQIVDNYPACSNPVRLSERGLSVEYAFSKLFPGLGPKWDWHEKNRVDGGVDFTLRGSSFDIKAVGPSTPYFCVSEYVMKKARAENYLVARYHEQYGIAEFLGCIRHEDAAHMASFVPSYGRYTAHFRIPLWALSPMHVFEDAL